MDWRRRHVNVWRDWRKSSSHDTSQKRSAVKLWDERQFRDNDDNVDFNTGNIKVALCRFRTDCSRTVRYNPNSLNPG